MECAAVSARSSLVLPFMVDPHQGIPYFILAQNQTSYRWPAGSGRLTLCGGTVKDGECVYECAAREFVEETCGCCLFAADDDTSFPCHRRIATLAERLRAQLYVFKMSHASSVVFVINVPWDPSAVAAFGTFVRCWERYTS